MQTNNLFTTPAEIDKAVQDFKNLSTDPGWITFTRILDANIEVVTEKILNRDSESTEADMDRLRDNL